MEILADTILEIISLSVLMLMSGAFFTGAIRLFRKRNDTCYNEIIISVISGSAKDK